MTKFCDEVKIGFIVTFEITLLQDPNISCGFELLLLN